MQTSGAAQGVGGSFKNRKPIGEGVVVSHGWQSEPIDGPKSGWNVDLSIYPSIHQSFYPSIHVSVYLPICLFISLFIHLSIYLSF
jgi:hypothetical protein